MATLWIDGYCNNVGDVGFLAEVTDLDHGVVRRSFDDRPLHTNLSHEPRLYGWCGTTNNQRRVADGLARVVRIAKNGRVCLSRIEAGSTEERDVLEQLGYPELSD